MLHPATDTLVGSDFAAICARYGAPLACRQERGVLFLIYAGFDGREFEAVQLVDGVVVAVADRIVRSERECSGQQLVGQPVELALAARGKPDRMLAMGDCVQLDYDDCVVTVHEGTVACVVPATASA